MSLTENKIYELVCDYPGLSTYDISKRLKMTGGRVRSTLSLLKKNGLIRFKFEKHNPRIKKLTFPIDVFSLLPRELKTDLKSLKL